MGDSEQLTWRKITRKKKRKIVFELLSFNTKDVITTRKRRSKNLAPNSFSALSKSASGPDRRATLGGLHIRRGEQMSASLINYNNVW